MQMTKYIPANLLPVLDYPSRMLYHGLGAFLEMAREAAAETTTSSDVKEGGSLSSDTKPGNRKLKLEPEAKVNQVLGAVQKVVAKPTLLEAKQCMACFSCTVLGVTHEGDGNDDDDTETSTPMVTPQVTPKAAVTPSRLRRTFSKVSTKSFRSPQAFLSSQQRPASPTFPVSSPAPPVQALPPRPKSLGIHHLLNLQEGPQRQSGRPRSSGALNGRPVVDPTANNAATLAHAADDADGTKTGDSVSPVRFKDKVDVHDCFFDSPVCTAEEVAFVDCQYDSDGADSPLQALTDLQQEMQFDDNIGHVILSVSVELENRLDHVRDLWDVFEFHAVLLCDGIVIAEDQMLQFLPHLRAIKTGSDDTSGKYSTFRGDRFVQKADVDFEVNWLNIASNHIGVASANAFLAPHSYCGSAEHLSHRSEGTLSAVCGLPLNPLLFTSAAAVDGLRAALQGVEDACLAFLHDVTDHSDHTTSAPAWTLLNSTIDNNQSGVAAGAPGPSGCNKWSVIVVGRTTAATVWAEKGYPMGFAEVDVTTQCNKILSTLLQTSKKAETMDFPVSRELPKVSKLGISGSGSLSATHWRSAPNTALAIELHAGTVNAIIQFYIWLIALFSRSCQQF